MKVYHIGTRGIPTTQGGIERHIEEITTRLAESAEITVYARSYYVPPMKEYKGVRIRRLPTLKTKHLDTILYALFATIDVLFRPRGIVHFHALGPSVFAWLPRLCWRAGPIPKLLPGLGLGPVCMWRRCWWA